MCRASFFFQFGQQFGQSVAQRVDGLRSVTIICAFGHTHPEEGQYPLEHGVADRPGRRVDRVEQLHAQVDAVHVIVQPPGDQMVQPRRVGRVQRLVGRHRAGRTPLEYREARVDLVAPFRVQRVQQRQHVPFDARHRVIVRAPHRRRDPGALLKQQWPRKITIAIKLPLLLIVMSTFVNV